MEQNKPQTEQELTPNMRRMRTRPTSKMSLLTFLPRLRPERSSLWLAA